MTTYNDEPITFEPLTDYERARIAGGLELVATFLDALIVLGMCRNDILLHQRTNRWHERMVARLRGEKSFEETWPHPADLPAWKGHDPRLP